VPDNLICKLISEPGYVVPESTKERCSQCKRPVWVAPSSRLILDEKPGIEIFCQDCVFTEVEPGIYIQKLTQAQLQEIAEYRRRQ